MSNLRNGGSTGQIERFVVDSLESEGMSIMIVVLMATVNQQLIMFCAETTRKLNLDLQEKKTVLIFG